MLTEKYKGFLSEVIYQIYPRSFKDSNGDGIGDLGGITEKLDHLKDLGITAIWLCPCYKSPNVDNGYDVADYRSIMEEFGTMEDMKQLIAELHSRGMKLIMDLVPNHTSSEHEWFQASRISKDNPYSDFYYWFDQPRNNWQCGFGGSAWQYDDRRKQYYLHSYAPEQPDLNWECPGVVKGMQDVVDFWVDLGVDGFRIDVIDQISKDFDNGRNCFGPTLHQHIKELFGREKAEKLFTVGECWCNDIDEIEKHCKYDRNELSTLFQFDHLECGRSDKFTKGTPCLKQVRDILLKWQMLNNQHELLHALFTDNHDNNRFLSRVGNEGELRYASATCIATLFYTQKGVPFIYMGQEFGMTGSEHASIDEFDDVETVNMYRMLRETLSEEETMHKINFGSRDNPRRPMPWDNSENAGFSTAKPWLPLHNKAFEINLENDLKSETSVYRFYKALLALRKQSEAIRYGEPTLLSGSEDNFFAMEKVYGNQKVTVVCNFEEECVISVPTDAPVTLSNNASRTSASGTYRPYEVSVTVEDV